MFNKYNTMPDGHRAECWLSPIAYHRQRLNVALGGAKRRSEVRGLPFDIDTDYLEKIYPEDGCCPALGITLAWGGARNNSPSLDRIVPELGYVRGNVEWLSDKANKIKSNATNEEILAVANYLKDKRTSNDDHQFI